jgi:hypothetical protein
MTKKNERRDFIRKVSLTGLGLANTFTAVRADKPEKINVYAIAQG